MSDRLDAAVRELVAALRAEVAAPTTGAPERLHSIASAADVLGIGRTALYGELQAGRIRSVKIRGRRLIPSSAIAERMRADTATNGAGPEVDRRDRSTPTRAA